MTPRERAEDLKLELAEAGFSCEYLSADVIPIIERTIVAAVEEERESIARYFDLRASLSSSQDGRYQWKAAATDVRMKADLDTRATTSPADTAHPAAAS